MSVQHMHSWLTCKPKEGVTSPHHGTRFKDCCKLPCGSWEPNWVLCKSKQGLLIDEASLQPFNEVKFYKDRKTLPPRISLAFNQQLFCVFFNCSSAETKAIVYFTYSASLAAIHTGKLPFKICNV